MSADIPHPCFDWDARKYRSNVRMHRGVSFDDAVFVFNDPRILEYDWEIVRGDERVHVIGLFYSRVLYVIYTVRHGLIRIISARPTEEDEELAYLDQ